MQCKDYNWNFSERNSPFLCAILHTQAQSPFCVPWFSPMAALKDMIALDEPQSLVEVTK